MGSTVKLGDTVRDVVCGFTGIAVARCEYLYQTARICVAATVLDGLTPIEERWVPEGQLEVIAVTAPGDAGS
jgi:hypothetical protein